MKTYVLYRYIDGESTFGPAIEYLIGIEEGAPVFSTHLIKACRHHLPRAILLSIRFQLSFISAAMAKAGDR